MFERVKDRFVSMARIEHVVMCVAMYAVVDIVARLFCSGFMFFFSVGVLHFLLMQVADSLESSVIWHCTNSYCIEWCP